jgi:hypothetical protein
MNHMNREISGIDVKVLDLTLSLERCEKELIQSLEANGCEHFKTLGETGIVETPKGIFVLEEDGIIIREPLSDTNRWPIDLYGSSRKDGTESIVMIPIAVINLSPDFVKTIPVKKTIPLEKFIRSFGRRLEENYVACLTQLRKCVK